MFSSGADVVAGVVLEPHRFFLLLFFGTSASEDEDLEKRISIQNIYHHIFLVNEKRMLAAKVIVRFLGQMYIDKNRTLSFGHHCHLHILYAHSAYFQVWNCISRILVDNCARTMLIPAMAAISIDWNTTLAVTRTTPTCQGACGHK